MTRCVPSKAFDTPLVWVYDVADVKAMTFKALVAVAPVGLDSREIALAVSPNNGPDN